MKIMLEVSDAPFNEYLDKIGAVNGTNAVSRARRRFKKYVQEVWNNYVESNGAMNSAAENLIEKYHTSSLIKSLKIGD